MPYFSKQQPRSTMHTKINKDQQNLSPFSNTRLSSMPIFKLYNNSYANFSLLDDSMTILSQRYTTIYGRKRYIYIVTTNNCRYVHPTTQVTI